MILRNRHRKFWKKTNKQNLQTNANKIFKGKCKKFSNEVKKKVFGRNLDGWVG